ncbi:Leucine-rich repeat-containing protein 51 [Branchiostoma belcheri]|nr:Leucine-rich repeat-containing protein 51 [Branchiostoma belcheri]
MSTTPRSPRKGAITAEASIDNENDVGPPIDFSFKMLCSMDDATEDEMRQGSRKHKYDEEGKINSNALRMNNNALTTLDGLSGAITRLFINPEALAWVDLSFNDLTTVDPVLLGYGNIKVLYLHGNSIENIVEVDKLPALPVLKNLTLHGNPIDQEPGYKHYILSLMPHLASLDFTSVSKADRATAKTWIHMYGKTMKSKKKKKKKAA